MSKNHEPENRLATPDEVDALVRKVGQLFTKAHIEAGTIRQGELLPVGSFAPLDAQALKESALKVWDSGDIQYSPSVQIPFADRSVPPQIRPAALGVTYVGRDPRLPGVTINRHLTLIDSTPEEPGLVHHGADVIPDSLGAIDPITGVNEEGAIELLKHASQDPSEVLAAEDALGIPHDRVTALEIQTLGELAVVSIRPETVRVVADFGF